MGFVVEKERVRGEGEVASHCEGEGQKLNSEGENDIGHKCGHWRGLDWRG